MTRNFSVNVGFIKLEAAAAVGRPIEFYCNVLQRAASWHESDSSMLSKSVALDAHISEHIILTERKYLRLHETG